LLFDLLVQSWRAQWWRFYGDWMFFSDMNPGAPIPKMIRAFTIAIASMNLPPLFSDDHKQTN
jgi:hypothetical protein